MTDPDQLQEGWVIEYEGREWRVDYVNASRAYILPVAKKEVEIGDGEEKRKFLTSERGVNISPTSCVKILRKEDPLKRTCVICGKNLHNDNKGDTHRACRKAAPPAFLPVEQAKAEVDAAPSTVTEATVEIAQSEPEPPTTVNAAEAPQKAEATVSKKSAAPKASKQKKAAAPKSEGRKVTSYEQAAKTPKQDEFRKGSQIEAVYDAVGAIGVATAAEVVKKIAGKVQTKGDLGANVAFYLSKLKGAGYLKASRGI